MVSIRLAGVGDVDVIVGFSYGLFQEDAGQRDRTVNLEWAADYGRAYFEAFIGRDGRHCWLAEVDGEAVGYLAGYVQGVSDYHVVVTAELESMFVGPSFRGQGVGKALAAHFMAWAKRSGAVVMTVTAYYANERAVNFYQRLGFRPRQLTLACDL